MEGRMFLGRVGSRATLDLGTFGATPLAMEAVFSGNKGSRARTFWGPSSNNSKHRQGLGKVQERGQAARLPVFFTLTWACPQEEILPCWRLKTRWGHYSLVDILH